MDFQASSPQKAPLYALYRNASAVDSLPETVKAHGINMVDYSSAHIQVLPAGGANPTVKVMWWSEEAGKFIDEQVALTKAGIGADAGFEFTVNCLGRIMLVAVTVLAAGTAKILVSGADLWTAA